jgi:hypothetical protein
MCLVRFLFGIAYTIDPRPLIGNPLEKLGFFDACQRFSHQSVRELQLSEAITKNYTPGLQIASMFSSKHTDLLKPMELMTNPIDLLNHVHETLGLLAAHFGSAGDFVSFDDMMTLLLALMSVNPPENAIAIAGFLTKWERVQLSCVIAFAKNAYCGAVDQIRAFAGSLAKQAIPAQSPAPTVRGNAAAAADADAATADEVTAAADCQS